MKILQTIWITGRDTIGVVLIENEIGQQSARIGIANTGSETTDITHIVEWGAKLTEEQAAGFFNQITNYKK